MVKPQSLSRGQYLGDVQIIRKYDLFTVSALSANPSNPGNDALHCHEDPIISFILEGDSIERIDNQTGERSAGDIRFYRAGELHQVKIKRFPSRNINFELNSRFLKQCGVSENELASAIVKDPIAKPAFLRTYRELMTNDSFTEPSTEILLLTLIGGSRTFSDDRRKPKWIQPLQDLLNDRWNEHLSLYEISREIGVHPVTISKYFTKYFSCTLGEYIRRLRVEKSLKLIKTSKLSLIEVAFQCGFADQSHFTCAFKKLTGFSPKSFRRL